MKEEKYTQDTAMLLKLLAEWRYKEVVPELFKDLVNRTDKVLGVKK